MTPVRIAFACACALLLAFADVAGADVRTDEKTKVELGGALGKIVSIFGGRAARDGVTSTVAVKGSRKITLNDTTGQIVDLSEEKIYDLDIKKKTYTVTTFADIRRRIEEARKKAEASAREEQAKEAKPQEPPPANNLEVDFDVKNTGQKKTINGFQTQQAILTVTVREKGKTLDQSGGLVMTNDMWLAPRMAAMKEIVDFEIQYAQKLYGPMVAGASAQDMASAMALYPMMKPALEKMAAEGSKLEGTPIMSVLTFEAVKSAAQFAAEQQQRQEESKPSVSGGLGGLVGGLARRAARSKVEGDATPRATFMTSTHEVLKISTEVSANETAIPPGFKQQ
jgi:hypothetical protein